MLNLEMHFAYSKACYDYSIEGGVKLDGNLLAPCGQGVFPLGKVFANVPFGSGLEAEGKGSDNWIRTPEKDQWRG